VAGAEGRHQAAEVRKDLGKENVHTHRRAVQGGSVRVRHLPELLPLPQVRGEAGLQVGLKQTNERIIGDRPSLPAT